MKKLTVLFAILFASAMVFAQNTSTVIQKNAENTDAYIHQTGSNDLYIKQVVTDPNSGDPTANIIGVDGTPVIQNGIDNLVRLDQAVTGDYDPLDKSNEAYIFQEGKRNKLIGATNDGLLGSDWSTAIQRSVIRYNAVNLKQWGGNDNAVGLFQDSKGSSNFGDQGADIEQNGYRNTLVVHQTSDLSNSKVFTQSKQIGNDNMARLKQYGYNLSEATIQQNGNSNFLGNSSSTGSILYGQAAYQYGGRSMLNLDQDGSFNKAGVFSYTTTDPTSIIDIDIKQTGLYHSAAVYQTGLGTIDTDIIQD